MDRTSAEEILRAAKAQGVTRADAQAAIAIAEQGRHVATGPAAAAFRLLAEIMESAESAVGKIV